MKTNSPTLADDRCYCQRRRAEVEVERAQQATLPEIVKVHLFAEAYLGKLAESETLAAEPS